MISFNEFVESKRLDGVIAECAQLMSEMEVDPHEYIYESLKKIDPVLAENFWGGVANFAKNVGQGVKQFFTNVGQGAQAGYKQASDTIAGPDAKFQAAERALTDLVKVLQRPEFSGFTTRDGSSKVSDYYTQVLKDLRDNRNYLPKMANSEINQDYASKGQVKAQNAQANQQQQQQQPNADQQQPSAREKFGYPAASQARMAPSSIIDPNTGKPFMRRVS